MKKFFKPLLSVLALALAAYFGSTVLAREYSDLVDKATDFANLGKTVSAKGFSELIDAGKDFVQQIQSGVSGQAKQQGQASKGSKADFRQCSKFFANGSAPSLPNVEHWKPRALCYDAFAVLHSGVTKTPLYVAERLNRAHLTSASNEKRTDKFFADSRLPTSDRAQLSDYKSSGLDRGHLAAAANMPTAQAMAQSFSLANMVPQAPENNRKSWAGIESATRKYVMRASGDVFVISGPIFSGNWKKIGSGQVGVPTHLFKLVYDEKTKRAWAHWIENKDTARVGRPITYSELVRRTGAEFLPGLTVKD